MRLKEDNSNYKASNVKRKLVQTPEASRHKSKKNTRRWCKGKVGTPHDFDITKIQRLVGRFMWIKWNCKNCGKMAQQIFWGDDDKHGESQEES